MEPPSSTHSADLATQLNKIELRYKTTLRTSTAAKELAETTNNRLIDVERQIDNMVKAINKVTNTVNTLNTAVHSLSNNATSSQRRLTAQPTAVKEEDEQTPKYSFHMKNFLKDPMQLHRSIHSEVEYLKFNGDNFPGKGRSTPP
jgi:uncharacterized protein YoxC